MEDLIRANTLLTSEDEPEEDFDETLDGAEKSADDESDEDADMTSWEN